jgi:RimJ/RimL family protein N-acetyltransferase
MLPDAALKIADSWWARDFACEPEELRPSSTRVQNHTGTLKGAEGIWILAVGPYPLVSMPISVPRSLHDRATSWSRLTLEDPALLALALAPVSVSEVIGPAFIGYATTSPRDARTAANVRQLHEGDAAAVSALRARCTDEEWEHGGSEFSKVPTFGAFAPEGELASLAGYERWDDKIAHISIVTATHCRHRGLATAAVAMAADHALTAGLLPQYRTLKSNHPSIRVAEKLGFVEYGISIYVKIAAAQPGVADGPGPRSRSEPGR